MKISPLQLVVIRFENDKNFHGQILRELDAVRSRGVIRLIDLLFVHKNDAGQIEIMTDSDLDHGGLSEYGTALSRLLGLENPTSTADKAELNGSGSSIYGITSDEIKTLLADIAPGTAVALGLFEHTWAGGLSEAIREAGGHLIAQGILTRDAVMVVGEELAAIAEAEMMIEATQAIKGAAVLDMLSFANTAEEIEAEMASEMTTSVIASETLKALMVAGVVDDSEIEAAIVALVEAGLLSPEIVASAIADADAAIQEVDELVTAQMNR
ncbi:hypothetical protein ACL6C3_08845 [Capilliphycus salinus ALCB114379]|uniref:hypothetical protein n=1 Tax=Capilliphycus salinus TaxID=2768948 RepID=UPI0039A4AD6C